MSGVEKLRLFVAVAVPEGHLLRIAEAVASLKETVSGARWAPISNQHITLKFLGSTPADRLEAVAGAIAPAAASNAPADVTITELGAFPRPSRARVVWVGVYDPAGLLASLAADLSAAFEPLGYPGEQRTFTPHLTLARLRNPRPVDLGTLEVDLPPFRVANVSLYRSRLHPKGARYELIRQFELGER